VKMNGIAGWCSGFGCPRGGQVWVCVGSGGTSK
jgi:hypothetical protein